jgi:hypothetical protein
LSRHRHSGLWRWALRIGLTLIFTITAVCVALHLFEPEFHATLVVASETDIAVPRISAQAIPGIQAYGAQGSGRFFAWEAVLPFEARHLPVVEMSWQANDGQPHRITERLPHNEYRQRCVHLLRLDTTAMPIQVGRFYDGSPRFIESYCRQAFQPTGGDHP